MHISRKSSNFAANFETEIMLDLLAVIVFLFLIYLCVKMFGRYLWPAIIIGILACIVAAIFNVSSVWAELGFGLGLVVMLILDWNNSWRTVLGAFVGGLIGYGIMHFIPNETWGDCVFLLGVIIGGSLASEAAWEDVSRREKSNFTSTSSSGGSGNSTYKCSSCTYYNRNSGICTYYDSIRGGYESACVKHTL